MLPKGFRRVPDALFEVVREVGRVVKPQVVGYLPHRIGGMGQASLGLGDDPLMNQFAGRLIDDLPTQGVKVVGCHRQLVGVEAHGFLGAEVRVEQLAEGAHLLQAVRRRVPLLLLGVVAAGQFQQ